MAESRDPASHTLSRAVRLATGARPRLVYSPKVAEDVGNAPTSGLTDLVFKSSAASLYLPVFQNGDLDGIRPHDLRIENPTC